MPIVQTKQNQKSTLFYSAQAVFLSVLILTSAGLILLYGLLRRMQYVSDAGRTVEAFKQEINTALTFMRDYTKNLARAQNAARDLNFILPYGKPRFADIITQLEYTSIHSGLVLKKASFAEEKVTQDTVSIAAAEEVVIDEGEEEPTPYSNTGVSNNSDLKIALVTIQVSGYVENVFTFIKVLENNLPLFDVAAFKLTVPNDTEPNNDVPNGEEEIQDVQDFMLVVKAYYL